MLDPDVIDITFYGLATIASLEQVWWWRGRHAIPGHAKVTAPALLSAVAVAVALGTMVFISSTLLFGMNNHDRLFWNPLVRRVQGVALTAALCAHWWWRWRAQ